MSISPLHGRAQPLVARFASEFPGWNVEVHPQSGRWLATRAQAWDWCQFAAGCRLFVAADSPDELAGSLTDQEQRAAQADRASA